MMYTPQLLLQHNSQVICHGNTQNESKKPSAEKAAALTLKMLIHGDNCQMQTEVICVYFHISFHWSQHHTGQTANTYRESKKQGSLQIISAVFQLEKWWNGVWVRKLIVVTVQVDQLILNSCYCVML